MSLGRVFDQSRVDGEKPWGNNGWWFGAIHQNGCFMAFNGI